MTQSAEESVVYDVFVSYAHQDAERVGPLVQALRARGLDVWLDVDGIETHASITKTVSTRLARSRVLLAFYSRTYPTRRACQWELTAAFLAAQRAGDDPCERVLVVNPERGEDGAPSVEHIQPVQLRDARFSLAAEDDRAEAWAEEATRVAEIAAAHEHPLGGTASELPRQLGERLVQAPGFVGRVADLWSVHSALTAGDASMVTGAMAGEVALLIGLGGVGKSMLAVEYALRFAAAYPGGVFWLRADGGDDEEPAAGGQGGMREAQFGRIATELGIKTSERSAIEIRAEIAKAIEASERCLWVVDDLPAGLDAAAVQRWLAPHPAAKTLITTRSREYQSGFPVYLGRLSPDDGYQLLTSVRPLDGADASERKAARGIVEDLGGHPLALNIAAHALRASGDLRSFASYRKALAEPTSDELQFAAELAPQLPGHEQSISVTLMRSIGALEQPGRDLLLIASLLASLPLPRSLLVDAFAKTDGLEGEAALRVVTRALVETENLCLCEAGQSPPEGVSVHALVARTVRFMESDFVRAKELRESTVEALAERLMDSEDVNAHERLGALITHGRALLARVLQQITDGGRGERAGFGMPVLLLCQSLAGCDFALRDYEAALRLQRIVAFYVKQAPGEDSPFGITTKASLARTLRELGELGEARELYESAIRARHAEGFEDDSYTAHLEHELEVAVRLAKGETMRQMMDEGFVETAVRITTRNLGTMDEERLQAYLNGEIDPEDLPPGKIEEHDLSTYGKVTSEEDAKDDPPRSGLDVEFAEPKQGRNEPCACGSGKKFKRCCGA
jgi:tetratricopeptide (TPR) repeat protein